MSLKQIFWQALSLGSVMLLLFAVIGTGLLLVLLAALAPTRQTPEVPNHKPAAVERGLA